MKIGVGGSAGGVRAGVSNRGVGGGVGPLSAGKSFRRIGRGGSGEFGFGAAIGLTILILIGLAIVLVAGPFALACLAFRCYRSGRKALSVVCLVAAMVGGWASFTYALYPTYAHARYDKDVPYVDGEGVEEARTALLKAGFQHVVMDPASGHKTKDGECYVKGTNPADRADPRKTIHITVDCW